MSSTFGYNTAQTAGSGIHIENAGSTSLDRLVVAIGSGIGIVWDGEGSPPVITCTDAYGNVGGNYGANLGDQTGVNGNISEHPLFCGSQGGDDPISLELRANSPCLPENNDCGMLMGAHEMGCVATATGGRYAPTNPQLLQNHPNPFNPYTTIRFALPNATRVNLAIFDLSGREIRRLATGIWYEAGTHSLSWDGTNSAGEALPSGVYFYRLETENQVEARKLTLLR